MFKVVFIVVLLCNPAFSFSLDDALEKLNGDKIKVNGKSIDKVTDSLKGEADKKIAEIEQKINNKINKIDDKINNEVNTVISDVKKNIAELEVIKSKAYILIKFIKIFLAILSSSLVIVVFFVYRAFMKINGLKKVIDNVANYKDIEKRLSAIEKKQSKKISAVKKVDKSKK